MVYQPDTIERFSCTIVADGGRWSSEDEIDVPNGDRRPKVVVVHLSDPDWLRSFALSNVFRRRLIPLGTELVPGDAIDVEHRERRYERQPFD